MKGRKDSGFSAETAVSTSFSHSSTAGENGEVKTRDFAAMAEQEDDEGSSGKPGRSGKPVRTAGRSNAIANKATETREMAETARKTPRTPATSVAIKAGKDDGLVFGLRRLKVTAFSKVAGGKA
ncbi:hypothetical protein LTR78_010726 [Recurvomyces mirabilis]|uniref:Uncharacterized protein n=1 Tax=Recurvomyces mirabilis TaxID=574656 RepID=A0AAE0WEY4_9PEZI|nr:hypothetical protein LTR78_010726 [Recurvomyces mirabilis]KAK5152528.1 hypothetical protein LTS14_008475 [Recurvomyces mirabilis]